LVTVFLGGTCNESTWRDELISKLDTNKVDAFNPVVDDWNAKAQANEDWHKANDDLCLYCLTPEMTGYYSVFELGLDCGKRPVRTIFCFLSERDGKTFSSGQIRGFVKMKKDVIKNGGISFDNIDDLATFLNNYKKEPVKTYPSLID
jgi:hypothetical protein